MKVQVKHLKYFCTILKGSPTKVSQLKFRSKGPHECYVNCHCSWCCPCGCFSIGKLLATAGGYNSWLNNASVVFGALMLRRFPMSELKFYDANLFKLYNPFDQICFYMYIVTDIWWHVWCVFTFCEWSEGTQDNGTCSCMWQVLFASKEDPLERVAASATGIVTFDPQWYPWSPWGSRALRFISFPPVKE